MTGLQRYYSHYRHRTTSYYNPTTGGYWSELSKAQRVEPGASMRDVLEICDTKVLYLMPNAFGGYPSSSDWYSVPGIQVNKFLAKKYSGTMTYKGKRIDVYPLSLWFNVEPGPTLKEHIEGHRLLHKVIEETFQPNRVKSPGYYKGTKEEDVKEEWYPIELLATPSQLGNDLLKRSLPFGKQYEALPEEEARTLMNNMGQGRVETFYHGQDTIEKMYNYDGRWMYAACLRHVPTGPMIHDNEPTIALTPPSKTGTQGYIQGFYKASIKVPAQWEHIGLLPTLNTSGSTRFSYPNTPGAIFETWCTSSELALAHKHQWGIDIKERILWPNTDKEPEMLLQWAKKLQYIRMELAPTFAEPYRTFLRDSTRNILLHTIGSFNRYSKEYDGYTHSLESLPEDILTCEEVGTSGIWHYTLQRPLSPLQAQLAQPHLAHYVWGLARRKVTEAALLTPYKKLVAIRVDAVWSTEEAPQVAPFIDAGKVGQFVLKPLHNNHNLQWPHDNAGMQRLLKIVRKEEEEAL